MFNEEAIRWDERRVSKRDGYQGDGIILSAEYLVFDRHAFVADGPTQTEELKRSKQEIIRWLSRRNSDYEEDVAQFEIMNAIRHFDYETKCRILRKAVDSIEA